MANRLAREKSPYLRLHMNNPVDWYPWSEEAFKKAREEDKPIFLSIGYYTCHWCHVMNRESFMDPEVADKLNSTFICIKVDREERPDVDSLYMKYAMVVLGGGGWPLTVLLTPEKKPFYVATYLPKKHLIELADRVRELWVNDRERIYRYSDNLVRTIVSSELFTTGFEYKEVKRSYVDEIYRRCAISFDEFNGGFGGPPKFPTPHRLLFLMRYWRLYDEPQALEMVFKTLDGMRFGGIYDHLEGGFHRYSTDEVWKLPHFEKMLYDQAWLMRVYTEAYQISGDYIYRETFYQIFDFIVRNLFSEKFGMLYSAMDSESEGVEGRYYLWSYDEFVEAAGDLYDIGVEVFNIKVDGNYFEEATGRKTGLNILYPKYRWEHIASKLGLGIDDFVDILNRLLDRLRRYRIENRVKPGIDNKFLADWNLYTVSSLAYGGRVFRDGELIGYAERIFKSICEHMYVGDVLYHSNIDGENTSNGFLDDYASILYALNELYLSTLKYTYLDMAIEFANNLIKKFYRKDMNLFQHNPIDSEDLPHHNIDVFDGPYPSGLSLAIHELIRLSRLVGDRSFYDIALENLKTILPNIERALESAPYQGVNMMYVLSGGGEVVIIPGMDNDKTNTYVSSLLKLYTPFTIFHLKTEDVSRNIEYVKYYELVGEGPTIYVCRDYKCLSPTNDLKVAIEQILSG